ncbi:beta-lactamase hydrolase domain-containing protein [Psychrobacter sp. DM8]|uniref:beta-lactamase hydrolase domain-containing protein n=1 Tax=Psychrobacter sp. DM8 TaxID=3440636 RepID=UPI003F506C55
MTESTQNLDVTSSNDAKIDDAKSNDANVQYIDTDNGIALNQALQPYFRPDKQTIVCGALDDDKIAALVKAGVELVINLQPDDELVFDEADAVQQAGMSYEQLPISGANDLKQLNILAFDNILRQHHGKKIAMHCGSGNRVGAAIALRAGWLRGRKMDTAMARGQSHGLTGLEEEVRNRLLVPR